MLLREAVDPTAQLAQTNWEDRGIHSTNIYETPKSSRGIYWQTK